MEEEKNKNKNVKKIIIGIIAVGVITGVVVCFVIAYNNTKATNNQTNAIESNSTNSSNVSSKSSSSSISANTSNANTMNITSGGNYDLTGEYGSITVNTSEEVTLNLNGVEITNSNGPAINVEKAKKVTIVLSGENTATATTTEDLDGAIYSKADLEFSGTGSIEVKSNYDGIVSKDTLVI